MGSHRLDHIQTVAVSIPGGIARQYRVQFQVDGDPNWKKSGTFRTAEAAAAMVRRLEQFGYQARMVSFRIAPAAA